MSVIIPLNPPLEKGDMFFSPLLKEDILLLPLLKVYGPERWVTDVPET